MKVDNPMTSEFLSRYPVESARVLEQVATEHVVDLLKQISIDVANAVLIAMVPNVTAACLGKMETTMAAELLSKFPVTRAARIFHLLNSDKQQELSVNLSTKQRLRIRHILSYNALSAGDFMNPNVDMLPDSLTVADAIRRLEAYRQSVKCELYIVDQSHRFLGSVDLGRLLVSKEHIRLRNLLNRKIRPMSVHASFERILAHPGWANRQRLPVVDSDNMLVGIIDYARVKGTADSEVSISRDPVENVFSIATVYWLSMVQLMESLLNIKASKRQGAKQ